MTQKKISAIGMQTSVIAVHYREEIIVKAVKQACQYLLLHFHNVAGLLRDTWKRMVKKQWFYAWWGCTGGVDRRKLGHFVRKIHWSLEAESMKKNPLMTQTPTQIWFHSDLNICTILTTSSCGSLMVSLFFPDLWCYHTTYLNELLLIS